MKKIKITNSKLILNKEKIARLNDDDMNSLAGGASTCASFTCGLCTGGSTGHSTQASFTCNMCTSTQ